MISAGVRELRQRASELLRLVELGETIEITDQERIAEHHAAFGKEPGRLPDGTFEPILIEVAGCTGCAAAPEEYPEDAEFYPSPTWRIRGQLKIFCGASR